MSYKITKYSKEQAKKLGVVIKPSTRKNKKIDVFKDGKKISSIGAIVYMDYPNYIKKLGKEKADAKRRAYKARHAKDRVVKGSNGYYADRILLPVIFRKVPPISS